ncbi:MAG: hypothetical protein PF549_00750 [Patescibacteria group bacterium]|jgi:hypothetical protein|nr:hypothetical protein [Patescibacteria group bacterium]
MQINNDKKGFISIIAAITVVAVVGGGIFMGTAVIDNVAKSGCGDSVEKWYSGKSYGDIADNKEGAIEDAQKCQEAVIQAVEVAKANGALLGRASNISGSGVELISTEAVNMMMDYVEESSKPNHKPLQKNNKPPRDIIEEIEKQEDETEEQDADIEAEQEQEQEEVEVVEIETEVESSSCDINILPDGSPNIVASCETGNIGFWYSDKDGDIVKSRGNFRINIPEFGGYQEFGWEEIPYTPAGDSVCGFELSNHGEYPDAFFGEYEVQLYIDMQLIDSTGKSSNISSCQIKK